MFKIVILICAISTSPQNCTEQTAAQVLESPSFANELDCNGPKAQEWLAKIAIRPISSKEYPKTICHRNKKETND